MKVALVCIAKDEDNYIQEWLNYYFKLGIDKIYIYTNDWPYTNPDLRTKIIRFNGDMVQIPAYNNFIVNYGMNYDYAAFFDVDEYLTLTEHNNIKDFLSKYENPNGLSINWHRFHSCGLEKVEDNNYSVLKRFTRRRAQIDKHIKVILNMKRKNVKMLHPHHANVGVYDTDGVYVPQTPLHPNGPSNIAYISHFCNKSKEEWQQKVLKGRCDVSRDFWSYYRPNDWYDMDSGTEVEDTLARTFLYSHH